MASIKKVFFSFFEKLGKILVSINHRIKAVEEKKKKKKIH